MVEPMPIACSLEGDDYRSRIAEIRRIGAHALLGVEELPNGATLRLRNAPDVLRGLRAIAAAEHECCPFLSFDINASRGEIILGISAPPEARPIVRDLVRSLAGERDIG